MTRKDKISPVNSPGSNALKTPMKTQYTISSSKRASSMPMLCG